MLLFGCVQQEQSHAEQQRPKQQSPKQLEAAWPQKLKIGLVPEQNIFVQKKRYEPLLAQLEDKIGIPIEIKILPSYSEVVNNFRDFELDGAFLGSFTGTMAIRELGVEPLVRPQFMDNSATCSAIVFAKKGDGIRAARDMRGKRIAFVDKASSTGFLLPLAYFKSLGIEDYQNWFGDVLFSGTHEDAINDVLSGYADVGAVSSTIFYMLAEMNPQVLNELTVLGTSPLIPSNPLSVRNDLPEDLKQLLKQQLLTLHQSAAGRAILDNLKVKQFTEASKEDSQPLLDLISPAHHQSS
ncbi:MAG TPA: phosphate/phosphite/phosphonate ABC transporter substrate-binding protein [Geothermobacteraceae bacterium]|nr:phosphate/phosphite/phosphonate ABC transporter substrate-binding protein [Geothermobacteraceae bacterium]